MSTLTRPRPDRRRRLERVRELFCGTCGYGVVIRRDPPECPMCRATAWTERPSRVRWN